MSVADELKKLEDLRWNGTLTEAEFARAKAAVLTQLAPPAPAADVPAVVLGEHLAEVRYQNELERIDREWAQEREKYMITAKNGRRFIPTVGESLGGAVAVGVFGVIWTVIAFSITSASPNFGPPPAVRLLFPLFGVVAVVFGIWTGIDAANKAEEYTRAHAAYQKRRAAVKSENCR